MKILNFDRGWDFSYSTGNAFIDAKGEAYREIVDLQSCLPDSDTLVGSFGCQTPYRRQCDLPLYQKQSTDFPGILLCKMGSKKFQGDGLIIMGYVV